VGGVCAAFHRNNYYYYNNNNGYRYYSNNGYSNCTAVSSVNGQCTACKPGTELSDQVVFDMYSPPADIGTHMTQCSDICDPSTEFRPLDSPLTCLKRSSPGGPCKITSTGAYYSDHVDLGVDSASCSTVGLCKLKPVLKATALSLCNN